MGYMYDELKKILSPANGSTARWSPNNIRALYITRGYLIYVRHVGGNAVCRVLDVAKSSEDISRNGSTGALHNLLSNRKLSCLEEIYVDSVFQNYKGAMNLEAYVNSLVNDRGRLRFYGYVDFQTLDPSEISNKYGNDSIEKILYSYAEDSSRSAKLQYWSVGNPNWYLNHSLRPQDYPLDGERGSVGRWFQHCDLVIGDALKKIDAENKDRQRLLMITSAVKKDLENIEDIKIVLNLALYVKRRNIYDDVYNAIRSVFIRSYNYSDIFLSDLREVKTVDGKDMENLLGVYRTLGVFVKTKDSKETSFADAVKSNDGLVGYAGKMNELLIRLNKSSLKLSLSVAALQLRDRIPACKYRDMLPVKSAGEGDNRVYVNILLGACGFTKESFNLLQKEG